MAVQHTSASYKSLEVLTSCFKVNFASFEDTSRYIEDFVLKYLQFVFDCWLSVIVKNVDYSLSSSIPCKKVITWLQIWRSRRLHSVTFKHLLNASCSIVNMKFAVLTLSCMQEPYIFCPSANSLKSVAELIEQNCQNLCFFMQSMHA
jgi:hypothetical protein